MYNSKTANFITFKLFPNWIETFKSSFTQEKHSWLLIPCQKHACTKIDKWSSFSISFCGHFHPTLTTVHQENWQMTYHFRFRLWLWPEWYIQLGSSYFWLQMLLLWLLTFCACSSFFWPCASLWKCGCLEWPVAEEECRQSHQSKPSECIQWCNLYSTAFLCLPTQWLLLPLCNFHCNVSCNEIWRFYFGTFTENEAKLLWKWAMQIPSITEEHEGLLKFLEYVREMYLKTNLIRKCVKKHTKYFYYIKTYLWKRYVYSSVSILYPFCLDFINITFYLFSITFFIARLFCPFFGLWPSLFIICDLLLGSIFRHNNAYVCFLSLFLEVSQCLMVWIRYKIAL